MSTADAHRRNGVLATLAAFQRLYPAITVNEVVAFLCLSENEGVSLRDLARLTGLSEPTTSRSIRTFGPAAGAWGRGPRLGLVEAFRHPDDHRTRVLRLTAAGAGFRARLALSVS
jgi:DNA-binding MarR family transcriptional regulator